MRAVVSPTDPLVVVRPARGEGPLTGWRVTADRNPTPVWAADNDTELSDFHFTADGSLLVHRDYRAMAKRWRDQNVVVFRTPATGEVVLTLAVEDGEAWYQSAVSPDGALLATIRTTRAEVFVRRLSGTAAVVKRIGMQGTKYFTNLAFHPSGRFLAVTNNDETVRLYDAPRWKPGKTFEWGVGKPRSVAFSPDGSLAAAACDTGQVVVWDVDW